MAEITVEAEGPDTYRVRVSEGSSSTTHTVTADADTLAQLSPGTDGDEVVRASFRFLLDREPKESILGRFGILVIERYFPEYRSRLGEYVESD